VLWERGYLVPALAAIAATTAAATEAATATTAAAAEAATTATAAEATTWALFLRTGFIDGQLTAAEIDAVHLLCRDLGLIGRAHGDKRETAGAAGHLVHGDVNIGNSAELTESGAELVFGSLERQVADV
jgi:hypothetical protein